MKRIIKKNEKASVSSKGEVIIYKTPEGETTIDVKFEKETLWLTHQQIATLFKRDRTVITRHLTNIFKTKELEEKSNVQKMHIPNSDRPVKFYNLDVILSVGYRVNSKRGTQFRIWANKVLKDYLVKGYSLNEKKLNEQTDKVKELEKSIEVFKRVADSYQLEKDDFSGILKVISDYTYALDILDQYDHQKIKTFKSVRKDKYIITYEDSIMMIKNHSFIDGNKRITAALFLMYLDRNNFLYRSNGEKRIADNALVALCLMIALSNPKEKNIIVKIVINLINQNN